jgi:radical SAM protein with 4Fe4S-binding SPASM domain
MPAETKIKSNPKVVFREEEGTGLLFNPESGKINLLNSTGRFIWPLLDGTHTRRQIISEILEAFEAADEKQVERDFDNFIESLCRWGVLDRASVVSVPIAGSICFGITSRCNFSCKHCLNRSLPAHDPDLTTEELIRVIDQMIEMGVKGLSLFGGEPLMHPDFKKIVEYLNKSAIGISLNTNAALIDREMARWLKEHKMNGTVVSFDGSSAQIMDAIRGKGAFEAALKGIEALRSEGLGVLLSVTLNKINYQDVRKMVLLGKKINGNSIRFNHVFFGGNAACYLEEIYLSPQEEKEAIEAVWQVKEEFGAFINASSSYLCQKEKLENIHKHIPAKDKIIVHSCGAARGKFAIRPDGWVVPCEIIWEVKCGNLREKSLKEIWDNSEVMNSFRMPLEVDLGEIPECKGCQYQYLCFHGHRCYPYHYPGGIKNRALYCWLKKEKGFV